MPGLIYAWDAEEIQAIDEGNFESMVIDVADDFFSSVDQADGVGLEDVTVTWRTASRDHGGEYRVASRPLFNSQRYKFDIKGTSRGGEYTIDLTPSEMSIVTKSTGRIEELEHLELRLPQVAIDTETEGILVPNIPEEIRKRLVEAVPRMESNQT